MVEVKNIYKSFGDLEVLEDVSYKFKKGKTTVIIGSSGSGKSTLLRCINQLEDINNGEIIVDGKNILEYKHQDLVQKVGMVFQQFNLFSNMTVLDNVMYALIKVQKIKKAKAREMAINALKTVKKLIQFHSDYKQDLASLYFENKKFRLALKTLDELDEEYGISKDRDAIRNTIYNATGDDKERIEYLEERITIQPNNESNYLNLIYRYSERKDKKRAFEVAKKLLAQKPKSQLVHLALYKFYLDQGEEEKGIASMKVVVKSAAIKPDAKAMVLNDFVKFVKDNPQYEDDLLEVTTNIANDETGKSHAELGNFYLQKKNKLKALDQFKLALDKDAANFNLIKKVLQLQIDLDMFEEAESFSSENLELYPSQPILYLANGVANNNLNQPKKAIESLETGVDYIIDDVIMEVDFYKQLSIAYKLNNNITKSNTFSKKADDLLNKE